MSLQLNEIPTGMVTLLALWTLPWKGYALWKAAAQKKDAYWFVALFLLNTLGILEILYIFVFSKKEWKKPNFSKK